MNMLNLIQQLLKRELAREKSKIKVLPETLSLLGALLPDSRSYKNDNSDFAANEREKSLLFEEIEGEKNNYRITLVHSILPSMLKLYVSAFSQNLKFTFLQLIEEIVLMLSGETLREYMQPYLFSRFVITTMKSENYTWIETCLRILQILVDKRVTNCNLALHREGIREYLSVFADKEKFKELTGIQITDDEPKEDVKQEEADGGDIFGDDVSAASQPSEVKPVDNMLPAADKSEEVKELEPSQAKTESQNQEIPTYKAEEEEKKEVEAPSLESTEVKETHKKEPIIQQVDANESKAESQPVQALEADNSALEEEKELVPLDESSEPKTLSEKVNELKEHKTYLDDLKFAIKESMGELIESGEELDEKVRVEVAKEEQLLKSEVNETEQIDTSSDKTKDMSKRKLKKMFIKKAIQNLDDNFEDLEELGDFEEGELEKIKDIIAKKRMLHKSKAMYNQEARKYSRDFIGINAAPMYKNIVMYSKKLLTSFEENLKEEFTKDADILERLTLLSQNFMEESKSARHFDREKTLRLFRDLADFFEGDSSSTKITQYELYKSKLVHALHSFLCLPLKEEESKSAGTKEEKVAFGNSDEYLTILSRYVCLIEVFTENESNKLLKGLISTFENAIKISFSNYYQQELLAYHDGVNLAYDLKKYSKRNKLQLMYEPNIESKIAEAEAAEKGEPYYKSSIKQYFKAKIPANPPQPKYEGEGFEDEDFLKSIPELNMDKYASKREVKGKPLIEEDKKDEQHTSTRDPDEDHSLIYLKRDALYKELKGVNVSVENSSTVEVIRDFLRNRVNTRDHVKQLKSHTNYGSISSQMQGIFDRARRQLDETYAQNPPGSNPPSIHNILSKMVFETFNESGEGDNLNEEERMLLIKDLETLIGKTPPKMYAHSYSQPGPTQETPKTQEISNEEEEEKIPKEELKETSSASGVIPSQFSSAFSEDPKLRRDSQISGRTISGDEEEIDLADKAKNKWGFFGKIKKFFFQDKAGKEGAEGEFDEEDTPEKALDTLVKKDVLPENSGIPAPIQETKTAETVISSKKEEDPKSKKERNKLMDNPISLKDLSEDEDVIYEFYYNRTLITSKKTIYELINYQPTHRSIVDPHVIYFRIKDRKTEKDRASISEESDEKSVKEFDKEFQLALKKERALLKTIGSNCSNLTPTLSYFMNHYISPYIKPDVKKESSPTYYNTNPYSYTQTLNKPSTKIGVNSEEQRLLSKKVIRILEALTYILRNWKEIRIHFDTIDKNKIIPKPGELYKNLLDEYVQKLLLEPLNLVLENKKHKCEELMENLIGNPYLLSFETRVLFFKTAAFAFSGEFHRTVHFLVQHLKRKHANLPDQAVPKQSKDKVKIDRKNLLESAVNLFTTPEIGYCNEEGTGLGPTLEFYYL